MRIGIKNLKKISILGLCVLLFKIAMDLGYRELVAWDTETYTLSFSVSKYIFSFFVLIVLFALIPHFEKKSSSFLLLLFYLFQIIPVTTIYAYGDDNTVFYLSVVFGFLLCVLLVRTKFTGIKLQISDKGLAILQIVCLISVLLFFGYLFLQNGIPSLRALNDIYSVYEMRAEGTFQTGKIIGYALSWVVEALLPFYIAKAASEKKYGRIIILLALFLLVYLYSGYKTYLFAIPLLLICAVWSNREGFYWKCYIAACLLFVIMVWFALHESFLQDISGRIFQLIGRRAMLVSANNKFKYYDFFSNHPKMGFYAVFPQWLIPTSGYYDNVNYTYLISEIYYNKPLMNSNTGFLAEGFMRFGHFGTFFLYILLAAILKGVDHLQERTSYTFAVTLFVYPIFSLSDTQLLTNIVSGEWLILILILLFYKRDRLMGLNSLAHLTHIKKIKLN